MNGMAVYESDLNARGIFAADMVCQCFPAPTSSSSSAATGSLPLGLLMLCGDVETNPGPPRRSGGGVPGSIKGPSADEKMDAMNRFFI